MALIETDASNPNVFGQGTFTPHADQKQFRSQWACIDGENDGRWPSVRQCAEGLPVGNDGRYRMAYEEFRDSKGKPHEITYGKTKLREMIVPIPDAEKKDRYEGNLSTQVINRYASVLAEKSAAVQGQTELTSTFETHQ